MAERDSTERIAADILIAALSSSKVSPNSLNTPEHVAEAFKVIYKAVYHPAGK